MSKLRSTGLCEKKIKCLKKGPSQAVEAVENTCFGFLFCFLLGNNILNKALPQL